MLGLPFTARERQLHFLKGDFKIGKEKSTREPMCWIQIWSYKKHFCIGRCPSRGIAICVTIDKMLVWQSHWQNTGNLNMSKMVCIFYVRKILKLCLHTVCQWWSYAWVKDVLAYLRTFYRHLYAMWKAMGIRGSNIGLSSDGVGLDCPR